MLYAVDLRQIELAFAKEGASLAMVGKKWTDPICRIRGKYPIERSRPQVKLSNRWIRQFDYGMERNCHAVVAFDNSPPIQDEITKKS